jgi:hypothetical protein
LAAGFVTGRAAAPLADDPTGTEVVVVFGFNLLAAAADVAVLVDGATGLVVFDPTASVLAAGDLETAEVDGLLDARDEVAVAGLAGAGRGAVTVGFRAAAAEVAAALAVNET